MTQLLSEPAMRSLWPLLRSMSSEVARARTSLSSGHSTNLEASKLMREIEGCLSDLPNLLGVTSSDTVTYSTFDINILLELATPGMQFKKKHINKSHSLVYGDYPMISAAFMNLAVFLEANASRPHISIKPDGDCVNLVVSMRSPEAPLRAALGRWVVRGFDVASITEDGLRPLRSHRLAIAYIGFKSGGAELVYDKDSKDMIIKVRRSRQLRLGL